MRLLRYLLIAFGVLIVLMGLALWRLPQTDLFWRFGGWALVDLAQSRIYGEVKVREVAGNPWTGLTFTGVNVKGPQGEVLQAEKVKVRFSLLSFLKLQPVIAQIAVSNPHVTLSQDREGRWNVSDLLRPRPPPPFSRLDFSQIKVAGGVVDLSRPGSSQHFENLEVELALTVIHPKRPQQAVIVHHADLTVTTPEGPLSLSTGFTYSRERLDLASLKLGTPEYPWLALAGELSLEKPEPWFNLAAELGPLPGGEIRRFWAKWPLPWDLGGKFKVTGTLPQLRITGEGSLQKARYSLEAGLRRNGEQWDYDLALSLRDLQPELAVALNAAWGQKLKGLEPLSVRLRLKGEGFSWPPRKMEMSLEASPFRYHAAQVEASRFSLTGEGKEQRLSGDLRGNFGKLNLTAAGPLLTSAAGDLTIRAEGFRPETLGLSILRGSLLDGKFSGKFRLAGAPAPTLAGEVEAWGQLAQEPLKELKGRFALDGARLEISQARFQLGPLTAEVKGTVGSKELDLHYRSSLAADGSWPGLSSTFKGRLEGEGTVKGPFTALQYTFQGKGYNLAGEGVALESAAIKAAMTGWPPSSGLLEIQGTGFKTPVGAFPRVSFSSRGEAGQWRFEVNASAPQGPEAELRGQADLRSQPCSLVLERCRWQVQGHAVANLAPIRIRFSPGWEVAPATFRLDGGSLSLQGQAKDGYLTGRLEVRHLPADLLSVKGMPLQGKIEGDMSLSGEPRRPVITGKLAWAPGKWGDFSFRSLQASLNYGDSFVRLAGSLEESAAGPSFAFEGRIPLQLSLSPWRWALGNRDFYLRVQGEKANLSLLTALGSVVKDAQGPLDITAQWQGDPHHPTVSGQIRWGPGSLALRISGPTFRLHPGQARLQGDKLVIPEVSLESGGGTARVSGEITLSGFHPNQFNLRAQLQDFLGLQRSGADAVGSGTATLTGSWSAPLVKGHIVINRATFRPTFFTPGQHGDIVLVQPPAPSSMSARGLEGATFYGDLVMDIVVEGPGKIWYRDRRLNVEVAGLLRALKKPGDKPYLTGEVHTLQGTYNYEGRVFKIVEGQLRFPANPKEAITLEGRATQQVDNLTLIASVTGALSKPQVRLESIPALSSQDLLSYLVFGRPARSLTQEEYFSAGQQAAGILAGLTAGKVQELLGKEIPLVGTLTFRGTQSEGRQTVGVGKTITKDITISFERKYDPLHRDNTEQVVLNYRFNEYLGVESQMGRRNTGADVLFNLDF